MSTPRRVASMNPTDIRVALMSVHLVESEIEHAAPQQVLCRRVLAGKILAQARSDNQLLSVYHRLIRSRLHFPRKEAELRKSDQQQADNRQI